MGRKERLFFHHIGDLSSVLASPGCFLPHEIFGPEQPGIGEAVLAVLRMSWNLFFSKNFKTESQSGAVYNSSSANFSHNGTDNLLLYILFFLSVRCNSFLKYKWQLF